MSKSNRKTAVKAKSTSNPNYGLNGIASRTECVTKKQEEQSRPSDSANSYACEEDGICDEQISEAVNNLFDRFESQEFVPNDFQTEIPVSSLESQVGYTSLVRQLQNAFIRNVAFHRSPSGGSLTVDEARAKAFHQCTDRDEAVKIFDELLGLPLEALNFSDLGELFSFSPRAAEGFWERAKREGRAEFESGHLAANITFPVGYMKGLWNIARYLGVRESFVEDWQPQGGIEIAMIDMLAQSFFQWHYWLELTVMRSETRPREEHHEYQKWKHSNEKTKNAKSWEEGYWFPPFVQEQDAVEHAVQMADRFNRIFLRTLRQLRDLRRYAPVTINNARQVNIATEGGKQLNIADPPEQ